MKKSSKIQLALWLAIFALSAICLAASWLSTDFSEFYRDSIFLAVQPVTSRMFGGLPFSAGEIMIYVLVFGGIALIFTYAVLMLMLKGRRKRLSQLFGCIVAWIALFAFTTETFNCFIMYHCPTFAAKYGISENEYTPEQLYNVTVKLISLCNDAAETVQRDESGNMLNNFDISAEASAAMNGISDKYGTLSGYYPNPKAIASDKFMTQLDLLGIYFPFSMEANYNPSMYTAELPSTVCHEFAHLKGWIQEDEANFISYLACVNSDSPAFVYSGYLSAVDYLWSAVYKNCGLDEESYNEFLNLMSADVRRDISESHRVFREAQQDSLSKKISAASSAAIETNLQLNGVTDGMKSYGRFVDLLLNYYS